MAIIKEDLIYAKNLVGDVSEDDLECVDVYVHQHLGIFIPSIGFCKYAIRPNHTHPSYSFIVFFSNDQAFFKPSINIPSDSYLCSAMSPDIPHEETVSEKFNRYIAIFIDKNFFENQFSIYTDNIIPNYFWTEFSLNKSILNYIKSFMNEYDDNFHNKNSFLDSLSFLITNEIIRSLLNLKTKEINTLKKKEVQKAIDYMNANFSEKITLESLCKLVNMSESNFNKLFKHETGLSPIKYLINIRIKKAKKFLRNTDDTITDISMKCGFYSVSHFSTCFMNQLNISPSDYQHLFAE